MGIVSRAIDAWADLEQLLGLATSYSHDEELFHDILEDTQRRFVEYVHEQEPQVEEPLPDAAVEEFWSSVAVFQSV